MNMGRYGGIFNQPFESGLGYSLALLGWYQLRSHEKRIPFWEYGRLLLLMFGGLASVSKVFLFAGIPLFMAFILACKPYRILMISLLVLIGLVFVFDNVRESWGGSSLIESYFSVGKGTDLLSLYTANRFAHRSTQVQEQFSEVWNRSPLFGFGFAPLEVMDNGLLWAFGGGGIIGGSIFVLILCKALVRTGSLVRKSKEQIFPFLMLLLMVMAAMGAPAFTINRSSTIFWTVYPLAILVGLRQSSPQKSETSRLVPLCWKVSSC
jgi:hypothetical protein